MAISKHIGDIDREEFYKHYLPDPFFIRKVMDGMMEKAMSKVAKDIAKNIRGRFFYPQEADSFEADMDHSIVYLGKGYDPYNHVGYDIALEVMANEKRQTTDA